MSLSLLASNTAWAQGVDDPLAEPDADTPPADPSAEPAPEAGAEDVPAEGEVEAPPEEVEASAEVAEAEDTSAEPGGASGDDIVVTGSRLKRTSFDAPSPVTVVDRGSIAKTGASNMRDIVANLPANNGAENNTGIGAGARGSAQFNLRGLGAGTTLVLLNGRRLLRAAVSAEGQPFDNAALIPLPLVERIEVMKGGASAIYGSDAVSGVVNIITRRKYNGVEVQLGGNIATQPGGLRDGEVSLTAGTANDTSGIGVTVSYYDRTALLATDRPYSQGRQDLPQWPRNQPVPAPTSVRRPDGLFMDQPWPAGYAYPTNLSNAGNPASFAFIYPMNTPPPDVISDPNCLSPQAVSAGSYQQLNAAGGANCGFDYTKYYNYVLPEERLNVYSTMEHDFNDHLHAFAEVGFFRLHINSPNSPSYSLAKELYVPTNHPDIDTIFPADVQSRADMARAIRIVGRTRGGDYPPNPLDTRHDNFRFVAGLRGDLEGVAENTMFSDWDWELSVTHQNAYQLDRSTDDITDNLQRSLNACTEMTVDPTTMQTIRNPDFGRIPCFHPFYNPANPLQNTQDRTNALGQTAIEFIQGTTIAESKWAMTVGDVLLRGSLARLPGGDLGFALGAQARHNSISYLPDHDGQLKNYVFTVGTPAYEGSNDVFAGFVEVGAPLLRGLELQGALRYEHYSDGPGGSLDPKIGVSYAPFATSDSKALTGLRFRGAYATSFRGPSLLQTLGRQVQLSDFVVGGNRVFRPSTTSGNPALQPEKSTALNGGFEYSVGGLALEAEYWRYGYESMVIKQNATTAWLNCEAALANPRMSDPMADVRGLAAALPVCNGVDITADGSLNGYNVNFINAASVNAHGVDFSANFRFGDPTSIGTFSIGTSASYLISYKALAPPLTRPTEFAGSRNAKNFAPPLPRLHATMPVSWSLGGHFIQATGKFVDSFVDDQNELRNPKVDMATGMLALNAMGQTTPGDFRPGSGPVIPAWFTLDLQYSYRMDEVIGDSTTFTIGAINVLDSDPPFVQTNLGYEGSQHDPRGRLLYAKINQAF